MNGIINILKPPGMSSHDIVYVVRKILQTKKVGHTGTLDPEAAGVLPVCIGKATKTVDYLTDKVKSYRAIIKLGLVTDTYDIYGTVLKENYNFEFKDEELQAVLEEFCGEIMQMPPIYSAIKINGKKLYQYALDNEAVEIVPRKIFIYDLKYIARLNATEFIVDVKCSKGTYIRSLCFDIGEKLGVGASMGQLIRIASSPFTLETAVTIEELRSYVENDKLEQVLIPIETIFNEYNQISIKNTAYIAFINGNSVYPQGVVDQNKLNSLEVNEIIKVYCEDKFLGTGIIKYEEETERRNVKLLHNFSEN